MRLRFVASNHQLKVSVDRELELVLVASLESDDWISGLSWDLMVSMVSVVRKRPTASEHGNQAWAFK
jgi:hypothetical protein